MAAVAVAMSVIAVAMGIVTAGLGAVGIVMDAVAVAMGAVTAGMGAVAVRQTPPQHPLRSSSTKYIYWIGCLTIGLTCDFGTIQYICTELWELRFDATVMVAAFFAFPVNWIFIRYCIS
ncbi:unnamed protein product [Phytophthora fragariaefolia]|uniref:Unnamed protein product n=1 Tax=Phytophthora fragariaefolia TaxID=1490495 RepID=A0A9W7D963_9STRA|nr:unnamed protein product [Phytophthora fragariaefolia]